MNGPRALGDTLLERFNSSRRVYRSPDRGTIYPPRGTSNWMDRGSSCSVRTLFVLLLKRRNGFFFNIYARPSDRQMVNRDGRNVNGLRRWLKFRSKNLNVISHGARRFRKNKGQKSTVQKIPYLGNYLRFAGGFFAVSHKKQKINAL